MRYLLYLAIGSALGAIALLIFFVFWDHMPAEQVGAKMSPGIFLYAFILAVFGGLVGLIHRVGNDIDPGDQEAE